MNETTRPGSGPGEEGGSLLPPFRLIVVIVAALLIGVATARIAGAHEITTGPYAGTYAHHTAGWQAQWAELVQQEGGVTQDLLELRDRLRRIDEALARARRAVERQLTPGNKIELWGGEGEGAERWRLLVERYFDADDLSWALRVIDCESAGDPYAASTRSSARGLFQHLERFWPERSAAAGWDGASIFDPEANVAVAAWLFYEEGASHWTCR